MMKSGIDQQALIDQFASASAQQTAQLRSNGRNSMASQFMMSNRAIEDLASRSMP